MNSPIHSLPQTEQPLPETTRAVAESEQKTPEESFSERGIIIVTALGHFICHLSENVYPAVMVAVMADFALSKTTGASLATLGYMLLGVGAIPVGMWADRWGPTRVFRMYFLLMVVAALLVAVTPNAWLLFGSLTLLGLTASIYHPVGLAMLSLGVKARGKAMGINGVAGNIGIALGPALGTALCITGWWRMAYVVVALLSLVSFLFFWWVSRHVKDSPHHKEPQTRQSNGIPAHSENGNPIQTSEVFKTSDVSPAWQRFLPLILLYAAMVCGGFNYRFLMTALPTYISGKQVAADVRDGASSEANTTKSETAKQSTNEEILAFGHFRVDFLSAFKVFLALLVGGVGQYAGGWLSDRFGARFVYPSMIATVVPLAITVGLLGGSSLVLLPACMLAACMFGQQPVENSVLAEKTSRGRRGLSYATKFTLTFGVGALGATVAGVVWERASLSAVFYLIAGSAVLMATLATVALSLRSTRKVYQVAGPLETDGRFR